MSDTPYSPYEIHVSPAEFKWMVEMMTSDLIRLLIEHEGYEFVQAFETVYNSQTYQALLKPESTFYYQSSGYVFQYLIREIKTGIMR